MNKYLLAVALMLFTLSGCMVHHHSIASNSNTLAKLRSGIGTSTHGVIIAETPSSFLVVTVAHLVDPRDFLFQLATRILPSAPSVEILAQAAPTVLKNFNAQLFKQATVGIPGHETMEAILIGIDYVHDLAVYRAQKHCKDISQTLVVTIELPENGDLTVGEDIYMLTTFQGQTIIVFSKTGFYLQTIPVGSMPAQTQLQTKLDVTHGTSGSPVFSAKDHRLIGLVGKEAVAGDEVMPLRFTTLVPAHLIANLVINSQANGNFICIPTDEGLAVDNCAIFYGKKSVTQTFIEIYDALLKTTTITEALLEEIPAPLEGK